MQLFALVLNACKLSERKACTYRDVKNEFEGVTDTVQYVKYKFV